MSATALSTYAFGTNTDSDAKRFEQRSSHGVVISSGISPFHVPKAIEVQLVTQNEAILTFAYENDEPPENAIHDIGDGLSVRLGEKSKKVLSITVRGNIKERLIRRDLFSTTYTHHIAETVPPSAAFSLRKNAEIIDLLLRDLPQQFIENLLHQD